MRIPRQFSYLVISVLVALCSSARAQETARISGAVSDASGAVMPGVQVKVTNVATNITATPVTNEQGRFTAGQLLPGEYRIEAEAPAGFKRFVRSGIILRTGDSLELPIRLELGERTDSVTITGETPLLQATTSSLGEVVDNKMVTDLPLNTRQPLSLVLLTPGINPNRMMESPESPFNMAPNFSISGSRALSNEILLDGTPNTVPEGSTGAFAAVAILPTVEATQEFKVQSNTYSAEYGRSGGGVVNIATRSGTNELRGSLFEFHRNSVLDANNFFNNRANVGRGSFKRNQFGASLGGPVFIPGLYDGRNRTFFYVSWETLLERAASTYITSVPTAKERAGDFSETFNSSGQQVVIYDPQTTTYDAVAKQYVRKAFQNNRIPETLFSPVAKKLMSFWPDPTVPGDAYTHAQNFVKNSGTNIDDHRLDIRGDQSFGHKHSLFGRFSFGRHSWIKPNVFGNAADPLDRSWPSNPTSTKVGYNYSINPNYLLDLKYAFNHLYFGQVPGSTGYDISQLGFPKYVKDVAQTKEFPRITFDNYANFGHLDNTMDGLQDSHVFMAGLSRSKGRHMTKVGADIRFNKTNRFNPGVRGTGAYSFTRAFTQGPNALAASTTAGNAMASALLGYPASGGLTIATRRLNRNWYQAFFVQDDWRVTSKLTLNMGARWDLEWPMVEINNNMNWFDPTLPSPIARSVPSLNLKGAVAFATDDKRNPYNMNWKSLAPRIGLAYLVSPSFVIRSGYGIFFSPHPYGTSDNVGVGFSQTTPLVSSIDGATPVDRIDNPFPSGFLMPFGMGTNPSPAVNLGLTAGTVQAQAPAPYAQQWNLALQRQLGTTLAVDVAYVGVKGTHLPDRAFPLNQLRLDQLGPQVNELVDNPFYGVITTGTLAAARIRRGQLMSAWPQYSSMSQSNPTSASSIFHSMQVKVVKRFSADLSFLASYTAGKLIDDSSGLMSWLEPATAHQDFYNRRASRAISDQDIAQRLVFTANYALPFGSKRRFGGGWSGAVNHILGGWQTNGILVMQSGVPLSISTTNTSYAGNAVLRPNNNGQSARLEGDSVQRLDKFFRTEVFTQPALYTFGNTGRNLPDVRGPGLTNLDCSLFKNIHFSENRYMQLRGEFFNFTNTPEFANPNTSLQSPSFGKITAQRNNARQIQVALRLVF